MPGSLAHLPRCQVALPAGLGLRPLGTTPTGRTSSAGGQAYEQGRTEQVTGSNGRVEMQQLRSRTRLGSRVDLTDAAHRPAVVDLVHPAGVDLVCPAAADLVRPAETPGPGPHPARRIRHQARDSLLVAGCSLALSVGATGLLWVLGRWLA